MIVQIYRNKKKNYYVILFGLMKVLKKKLNNTYIDMDDSSADFTFITPIVILQHEIFKRIGKCWLRHLLIHGASVIANDPGKFKFPNDLVNIDEELCYEIEIDTTRLYQNRCWEIFGYTDLDRIMMKSFLDGDIQSRRK